MDLSLKFAGPGPFNPTHSFPAVESKPDLLSSVLSVGHDIPGTVGRKKPGDKVRLGVNCYPHPRHWKGDKLKLWVGDAVTFRVHESLGDSGGK